MNQYYVNQYYVVGENIDGDIIEYGYTGLLENCIAYAKQTLYENDGGHLDIFVIHGNYDEFICDVEV